MKSLKSLFGKHIAKSIVASLVIFLAIGGFMIFVHSTSELPINQEKADVLKECIETGYNCIDFHDDEKLKNPTDAEEFERLLEKYDNDYNKALIIYNNYNYSTASASLFKFYRNIIFGCMIAGLFVGAGLYLFFSNKEEVVETKKEEKDKKKK